MKESSLSAVSLIRALIFSGLFLIYGLMLFVTLAASFPLVKENGLQVTQPQVTSAG